ncbi:endonuclease III domain-containing protein [Thermospira aquatica]|uniref:Endonuclease III n=1 Tax=Thermospira aquatica TaxID=2828656 RepID=A0AAX3BBY3_9SPIR|nr:endonuclease III [Thermospira aquatica]URA09779.1 endonuclease III [Thermospira aquatica]
MTTEEVLKVLAILKNHYPTWNAPVVTFIAISQGSPYQVLVATLLSLRTKDEMTREAAVRLFQRADTPEKMLRLSEKAISEIIYPVGFYRTKAKRILEITKILLEKYGGRVPDTLEELLSLPGVGRKTANLVITLGYHKPGICVDTHVHRISNRWDYVNTKNPHETEFALREKLPIEEWIMYNDILVAFGQTICRPISPLCDNQCPVNHLCPKRGVNKHR